MATHWIEISRSALQNNLKVIRSTLNPKTRIMAMVKANAYGHGIETTVPIISPLVDYFGVHTLSEALIIRKSQKKINTYHINRRRFRLPYRIQKQNLTFSAFN